MLKTVAKIQLDIYVNILLTCEIEFTRFVVFDEILNQFKQLTSCEKEMFMVFGKTDYRQFIRRRINLSRSRAYFAVKRNVAFDRDNWLIRIDRRLRTHLKIVSPDLATGLKPRTSRRI